MATATGIQWTDHSWNPWQGCTPVTAGCDHYYMFSDMRRYGRDPLVVRRSKTTFNDPPRKLASGKWRPGNRVFTCSWSDWFHPAADPWRDEAWGIIRQTPQLTYQILTKRPNRIARHLPTDWGEGYANVWLGTTVEWEQTAFRLDQLRAVPAAVRFVSYEPAIGPLDLTPARLRGVDWVIIGGESGGREARPFALDWARRIVAQCGAVGVAPFVKQFGSVWAREHRAKHAHGGDQGEWPADLRVQQYPVERARS